ncbi:sugar-phosphatase [Raineyella antarctica]|uniref:Sugar-phosphatase n=1 Tax=Raineyella antarctica TaxID=1577474 RepID=A0A1G6GEV7_9ACTN|nr:HAD-IA family hydrolase [Raineyella antarctica]SDB80507.1 sugar-phosphatase [Raineyella antarctica]
MTDRTYDAVIFDMDSTLVDSLPAIVRVWTRFAMRYGLTEEQLQGMFGRSTRSVVTQLVGTDRRDDALAWIAEHELADQEGVVALPGAAAALRAVGSRGAVATSATRDMAAARLAAAGLPAPAVLVTASDVERAKPDPEIFLRAADRLGADPLRCLVAEDAPNGLLAARAAGMATVAVATTHTTAELAPLADVVVPDLGHLSWRPADGGVRVSSSL